MVAVIAASNTALVTSGGTTAPSAGTVESWTVTTAANFPILTAGQSMYGIDAADLGKTSNFEVFKVTANANGTGASWTSVRAAVSSGGAVAPYAHAANWTFVPVLNPEGLDGRYQQRTAIVSSASVSGTKTIDWAVADVFDLTMTANTTFSFANLGVGCSMSLTLRVDPDIDPTATPTWPTIAWQPSVPMYSDTGHGMSFEFWVTEAGEVRGTAI